MFSSDIMAMQVGHYESIHLSLLLTTVYTVGYFHTSVIYITKSCSYLDTEVSQNHKIMVYCTSDVAKHSCPL